MFVMLTAPQNMVFLVAIVVMLLIVVLEAVSLFMGAGLAQAVDSILPEIDSDLDVDVDADASSFDVGRVLHWFRVGEVPVLMLFVVFLTAFGLGGLLLQSMVQMVTGLFLPGGIAAVAAFLAAVPCVRFLGGLLARYMPGDETYVLSENALIGRVATTVAGIASAGRPVQAKVTDEYGQTHYLLVEPDQGEEVFEPGEKVLLVSKAGAVYRAIMARNRALTDS